MLLSTIFLEYLKVDASSVRGREDYPVPIKRELDFYRLCLSIFALLKLLMNVAEFAL